MLGLVARVRRIRAGNRPAGSPDAAPSRSRFPRRGPVRTSTAPPVPPVTARTAADRRESVVGFDVPLPDFTDCAFATARTGPGLVRRRPRGRARSAASIATCRRSATRCRQRTSRSPSVMCARSAPEPAWPRGDLNLPRAFFTEKAFPENEAVWTTAMHAVAASGRSSNELIYERRAGARNQIEVNVRRSRSSAGRRVASGAAGSATSRSPSSAPSTRACERGSIGAAGLEVILPTGNEARGLGNGYTVFEPFAMWGQMLPRNSFLQLHGGVELPSDSTKGVREAFVRTAVGTTVRPEPRLRPRVVAAGRSVVGPAAGRRVGVGRRPAGAGHAVEAPARDARRRRPRFRSPSARSGATQALVYLLVGLVRRRLLRVLEMSRRQRVRSSSPRPCGRAPCCSRLHASRLPRSRPRPAQDHGSVRADLAMFAPSSDCLACHNNLVAPTGEDVSIGASWRGSMMANSARDPYVLRQRPPRDARPSRRTPPRSRTSAPPAMLPAAQKIAHAAGGRRRTIFAHAGPPRITSRPRSTTWRATASRARSAIRSPPSGSARARASTATSSSPRHAPDGTAPRVRPVRRSTPAAVASCTR